MMDSGEKNNRKGSSGMLLPDTDVLGQNKPQAGGTGAKARPARIFIGLTIAVVLAIIYWLLTGK